MTALRLGLLVLLALSACQRKTEPSKKNDHDKHAVGAGHDEKHDHEAHGAKHAGDEAHNDKHGGRGHGDHAGHGHAHQQDFTAEAITAAQRRICEHRKKVVDCDDCRYEAGVVQLPKEMINSGKKKGLVRTGRVQKVTAGRRLAVTGEVTFDERKLVHISPRISGVARQVHVTLGDRVKKGATLVQMDSLELGKLRASLLQARERLALARRDHEREKRLFADKISSGKDRASAETSFKRAQIELRAVRDQLKLLGLSSRQLEKIGRSGSGRMALRSPLEGTVVAKHVVPGELVKPEKVIVTVADLSTVWVWAAVYERDLSRLLQSSAGKKPAAAVRVDAFTDKSFEGVVDYVGATMDEATRTVKVRVVVKNGQRLLRPGMFASLKIELGGGKQLLAVPEKAVVRDEGKHFVFVRLSATNRFARRDVHLGVTIPSDRIEIRAGLKVDEEVVVSGAFLLKSDILREKMGAGCAD